MNRRSFFKSLFAGAAFVVAVELGLGNVTAEDFAIRPPTANPKATYRPPLPSEMTDPAWDHPDLRQFKRYVLDYWEAVNDRSA